MTRIPLQSRAGFSRVDLMVVMALIAVVVGLLFPAVYAAQVADAGKETQNRLKQVALAIHSFNDVFKKTPPAFGTVGNSGKGLNASLHVHILPYIEPEQLKLYREYLRADGKEVATVVVPSFLAKLDPSLKKSKGAGIQNFPANLRVFADVGVAMGPDGYDKDMPALRDAEPGTGGIPRTFQDGTSNTIVFATKFAYCGDGGSRYASRPNSRTAAFFGQNAAKKKADPSDPAATFQLFPGAKDCLCAPLMAQSFMKTSIHIALADGSVRMVSADISPMTWNSAMQPNDGRPLGDDW